MLFVSCFYSVILKSRSRKLSLLVNCFVRDSISENQKYKINKYSSSVCFVFSHSYMNVYKLPLDASVLFFYLCISSLESTPKGSMCCHMRSCFPLTLLLLNSRRQNFRLQIFKKWLSPSFIILRIQRLEGKQCRSR